MASAFAAAGFAAAGFLASAFAAAGFAAAGFLAAGFLRVVLISLESASTRARSFALYFRLRGFVRRRYPQQGHQSPSHFMKISHIWQRRWPEAYLPVPTGFCALYRMQMPLHVMLSYSKVMYIRMDPHNFAKIRR